jgi:hypothetical protein
LSASCLLTMALYVLTVWGLAKFGVSL